MTKFRSFALAMGACTTLALAGCGSNNKAAEKTDTALVGVNAFLWRASLDTINFIPLQSADPEGGIIITDWYSNPEVPSERFKLTIYILDTRLRADGVNVSVFKQVRNEGEWQDAASDPATAIQLENAILTRARELKVGDFS